MSYHIMQLAIQDHALRGEDRLALIAAGDNNGHVGPKSTAYWCGCTEDEALEIIERLVDEGVFVRIDGEVYHPYLHMASVYEQTGRHAPRQPSRKPIPRHVRQAVLSRDGNACHYCGSGDNLCLDHRIPHSKGGSDDPENLVAACRSCNSAKGVKDYDAFIAWLEARA